MSLVQLRLNELRLGPYLAIVLHDYIKAIERLSNRFWLIRFAELGLLVGYALLSLEVQEPSLARG